MPGRRDGTIEDDTGTLWQKLIVGVFFHGMNEMHDEHDAKLYVTKLCIKNMKSITKHKRMSRKPLVEALLVLTLRVLRVATRIALTPNYFAYIDG